MTGIAVPSEGAYRDVDRERGRAPHNRDRGLTRRGTSSGDCACLQSVSRFIGRWANFVGH